MNKSEQINELAAAMAKAQAAMQGVTKDAKNPFFKSEYATLAACMEAIKKPFADNGLSVVQLMDEADAGYVTVTTVLMHESGQWISGKITGKPVKDDPQGMGSAITYYRRYSLMAMVGLAPEDDDGNAASGKGTANEGERRKEIKAESAAKVAKTEAVSDSKRAVDHVGVGKPRQTASAIYCPLNDNKLQPKSKCADCDGKKECFE